MIRGMYSAISGLRTHQTMLDVVSNNLANVNTVGYKSSRVTFKDQLQQTLYGGSAEGPNTGVVVRTRPKTRKPAMYKVLMLNDDYTPMEFVVDVLQHIFQKNREEATQIMLHVHQKGVGVCGVYTYEVAETKVTQTVDYARKNQHPLQCTLEKD